MSSTVTTEVTPPGQDGGPQPRKPLYRRRWFQVTGAIVAALIALIAIGSATNHPNAVTPAAQPSHSAPAPAPSSPAASSPAPAAPVTPAAPANTGPVGTTYTVTASDGTKYDVTLTSVAPASLTQYESLNTYSDHMVAASLTITGDAGQSSDDANSDLTVIGSDGQVYQPSFNDTTAGTNFNAGQFTVNTGSTERGVVNFEMPAGVTVKSLQWAPGYDSPTATWTVGA